MSNAITMLEVVADNEVKARFTQLGTARSYQRHLESKGMKTYVKVCNTLRKVANCNINGKKYLFDFVNCEFLSKDTCRVFAFDRSNSISQIADFLKKYDV